MVNESTVGFNDASPNASTEPLDETAPPCPGEFQSDLCAAIEHEARRAEALADAVGLVRFAMAQQTLQGPVNAVTPEAVTQAAFAQALAASLGRRAWMRVPRLPLRGLLGEMSALLLDVQNAVSRAGLARGCRFLHPRLGGAQAELAGT